MTSACHSSMKTKVLVPRIHVKPSTNIFVAPVFPGWHEAPWDVMDQLAWHSKWENNRGTLPQTRWKLRTDTWSFTPVFTHRNRHTHMKSKKWKVHFKFWSIYAMQLISLHQPIHHWYVCVCVCACVGFKHSLPVAQVSLQLCNPG